MLYRFETASTMLVTKRLGQEVDGSGLQALQSSVYRHDPHENDGCEYSPGLMCFGNLSRLSPGTDSEESFRNVEVASATQVLNRLRFPKHISPGEYSHPDHFHDGHGDIPMTVRALKPEPSTS